MTHPYKYGRPTVSSPASTRPLRYVSQYAEIFNQVQSVPAGYTRFIGDFSYTIAGPCDDLRVQFNNWWTTNVASLLSETDNPDAVSITKLSLIYNNVVVHGTFSAADGVSLDGGMVDKQSDGLKAAVFGAERFSGGSQVRVKFQGDLSSDAALMPSVGRELTGATVYLFDPVNDTGVDQIYTTAALVAPVEAIVTQIFAPTGLIARYDAPQVVGLNIGDSIGEGNNDNSIGWMRNSFAGIGAAYLNMTMGGSRWTYVNANFAKRRQLVKYTTHAVCELGTNDAANSVSVADMTTASHAIYAILRAESIQKIYQSKILPRCHPDTWGCSNIDQQVPLTQFLNGAARDQINAVWIADVGPVLDGFLDTSIVEAPSDHTKWNSRPYASTLAAAAQIGDSGFSVNNVPTVGEVLVIDPGTANYDSTGTPIISFSGNGPYTIVQHGALSLAHDAGAVVNATLSEDGIHPSGVAHALIVTANASTYRSFTATA